MLSRRMLRSLKMRGIRGSLDVAVSAFQERLFDVRYGVDTVRFSNLESLDIMGPNATEGCDYQPTRLRHFRKTMATLMPAPDSCFVDYGCGKGRVLMLATEWGFSRVSGVEFAPELCAVARKNLERYRRKTRVASRIEVFEGDAVDYAVRDDDGYFFFNNPFGESVMKKVVDNIVESVSRANRRVFLIYFNPLCRAAVDTTGFDVVLEPEGESLVVLSNERR